MMQMLQMMLQMKLQQIPTGMMKQMENQLKRVNPQAFKEYQQARKENNPEEYLNKVVNGFNPQQKETWDAMMRGINTKSVDINIKKGE